MANPIIDLRGTGKVTGSVAATDPSDLPRLDQVQALIADGGGGGGGVSVALTGATMSGPLILDMSTAGYVPLRIEGNPSNDANLTEWRNSAAALLASIDQLGQATFVQASASATAPTLDAHLTRKDYVDDQITNHTHAGDFLTQAEGDARYINASNDTMTGPLVTITPTEDGHAANKLYVDTVMETHESDGDPHWQYLTQTEGDDRYIRINSGPVEGNLHLETSDTYSNLTDNSVPLTLGFLVSENMVFDQNKIQARNNNLAATLILQPYGGAITVSATETNFDNVVTVDGAFYVQQDAVPAGNTLIDQMQVINDDSTRVFSIVPRPNSVTDSTNQLTYDYDLERWVFAGTVQAPDPVNEADVLRKQELTYHETVAEDPHSQYLTADEADGMFLTQEEGDLAYVNVDGDIMTGELVLQSGLYVEDTTTPYIRFDMSGLGPDARKWVLYGSGGDLRFSSTDDALAVQSTPINLHRNGQVDIGGPTTIAGRTTITSHDDGLPALITQSHSATSSAKIQEWRNGDGTLLVFIDDTGTLDMGAARIENLADPGVDTDAATKKYVDETSGADLSAHLEALDPHQQYLLVDGTRAMAGDLLMGGNDLQMSDGIIALRGLANNEKIYVDTASSSQFVVQALSTGELRTMTGGSAVQLSWNNATGVRVHQDLLVSGGFTATDSVISLGGADPLLSNDGKDRGIEFRYYDASSKLGFIGWDNSSGKFVLLTDATNTSEVISGTKGTLDALLSFSNVTDWSGTLDGRYVNVTGDTMTGDLTLAGDPTSDLHAVTKGYADGILDDHLSALDPHPQYLTESEGNTLYVNVTGDTMIGALTLPTADPTSDNHAARKLYVDNTAAQAATAAIAAHVAESDPHPQYVLSAGDTMTGALVIENNSGGSLFLRDPDAALSAHRNIELIQTGDQFLIRGVSDDLTTVNDTVFLFDRSSAYISIGSSGGNEIRMNNATSVLVPDATADGEAVAYDQSSWQLGSGTFTGDVLVDSSRLEIRGVAPAFYLNETDAPVDAKLFRMLSASGSVYFQNRTDADADIDNLMVLRLGSSVVDLSGASSVWVPDATANGEPLAFDQSSWQLGSGTVNGAVTVDNNAANLVLNTPVVPNDVIHLTNGIDANRAMWQRWTGSGATSLVWVPSDPADGVADWSHEFGYDYSNTQWFFDGSVLFLDGVDFTDITASTLRLTSTADLSLSSTNHAFQIGADNSLNLAIDQNEIMARSNGATSTLNLNVNGGLVNIGSGGLQTSGSVAVNGGSLTTTSATFNLVDTNATTVNIAGAATTVEIGSASGTTTIHNATTIEANTTVVGTLTADQINLGTGEKIQWAGDGSLTYWSSTGSFVFHDGTSTLMDLRTASAVINVPTTVDDDLTVSGNLTVNGTTTTVNSTVTTLDDPIITLGGDTPPTIDDAKDRGVEFRWYDGGAKTGFFGFDDSSQRFVFIPDGTNASEVYSGSKGDIEVNDVYALGLVDANTLDVASTSQFGGDISLGTGAKIDFFDEAGDKILWYSGVETYSTGIASSTLYHQITGAGKAIELRTNSIARLTVEDALVSISNNLDVTGYIQAGSYIQADGNIYTGAAYDTGTVNGVSISSNGSLIRANVANGGTAELQLTENSASRDGAAIRYDGSVNEIEFGSYSAGSWAKALSFTRNTDDIDFPGTISVVGGATFTVGAAGNEVVFLADGVAAGNSVANSVAGRFSSAEDRFYWVAVEDGGGVLTSEFSYSFATNQWGFDAPLKVVEPALPTDAASKGYVDGEIDSIETSIGGHVGSSTDAHNASAISILPPGAMPNWYNTGVGANHDVQTALNVIVGQVGAPSDEMLADLLDAINNYGGGTVITDTGATSIFSTDAITASVIAAGTILGNNIAAGTITANNIAAQTITGDLISASTAIRIGESQQIVIQGTDDPSTTSIRAEVGNPLKGFEEWVFAQASNNSLDLYMPNDNLSTTVIDNGVASNHAMKLYGRGHFQSGGDNTEVHFGGFTASGSEMFYAVEVDVEMAPYGDQIAAVAARPLTGGVIVEQSISTGLYRFGVRTSNDTWTYTTATALPYGDGERTRLRVVYNGWDETVTGQQWDSLNESWVDVAFASTAGLTLDPGYGYTHATGQANYCARGSFYGIRVTVDDDEEVVLYNPQVDLDGWTSGAWTISSGQTVTLGSSFNEETVSANAQGFIWCGTEIDTSAPSTHYTDPGFTVPNVGWLGRKMMKTQRDGSDLGGSTMDVTSATQSVALVLYIPDDWTPVGTGIWSNGGTTNGMGLLLDDDWRLYITHNAGAVVLDYGYVTLPGPGLYTIGGSFSTGDIKLYINGRHRLTIDGTGAVGGSGDPEIGNFSVMVPGAASTPIGISGSGLWIGDLIWDNGARDASWFSEFHRLLFSQFATGDGFHIDASGRFSAGTDISWDGRRYFRVGDGLVWDDLEGTLVIGSATSGSRIESGNYSYTSGDFSDTGTLLELDSGAIVSPQFSINDSTGDAKFAGELSAPSGNIGGWTISGNTLVSNNVTLDAANDELIIDNTGRIIVGEDSNQIILNATATDTSTYIGAKASSYAQSGAGMYADASGRFSLGDKLTWDGSSTLTIDGNITASTGTIGGWDITATTIEATSDNIVLTNSGRIDIGSTASKIVVAGTGSATTTSIRAGATAFETGTGFWLDASGRMYFGASGNFISFDGSAVEINTPNLDVTAAGNVTMSGTVTATAGDIASWNISGATLRSDNLRVVLDAANELISVGGGASKIGIQGGDGLTNTYIRSGSTNYGTGPGFWLDASGRFSLGDDLVYDGAGNLSISGAVTAVTGAIGGWEIGATTLESTSSNVVLSSASDGEIRLGPTSDILLTGAATAAATAVHTSTATGYNAGTGFWVDGSGRLFLGDSAGEKLLYSGGSLSVSGTLTSTDGNIGGWTINNGSITSPSSNIRLDASATRIQVGADTNKITLDGTSSAASSAIFSGSTGYGTGTGFWMDASGRLSLGSKLTYDGAGNLTIDGSITATVGSIGGWLLSGTTIYGDHITLDDANDEIKIGSAANHILLEATGTDTTTVIRTSTATAYNTGSGFWMDGSGRLFLGTSGGDKLLYSGGTLAITGNITADGGNIGGWDITGSTIESTSDLVVLNAAGSIVVGSATNKWNIIGSGTDAATAIYTTGATWANTTGVWMDASGRLRLGDGLSWDGVDLTIDGGGIFSGDISAASGTFTGNLSGSTITGGQIDIGEGAASFHVDSTGQMWLGAASVGSAPFVVTAAGALTATGADVTGTITATDGLIGSWEINAGAIENGDVSFAANGDVSLGTQLTFEESTGTLSIAGSINVFGDGQGVYTLQDFLSAATTDLQIIALTPYVMMRGVTVYWAAAEDDFTIFKNGIAQATGQPTGAVGSFSTTAGDIIEMTRLGDVHTTEPGDIIPFGLRAQRFTYRSTRYNPDTLYFYSPSKAVAEVNVWINGNDPELVAADFTVNVASGSVGSVTLTGQASSSTIRVRSNVPVVALKRGSGGDYSALWPIATETIGRTGGSSSNFYTSGSTPAFRSSSGSYGYMSTTDGTEYQYYESGDGDGGNGEQHVPIEATGDCYIVYQGSALSEYVVMAIEPVIIQAWYWGGSGWVLYSESDFTNASRSSFQVLNDTTPSTESALWRFESKDGGRFALRLNDTDGDEYPHWGHIRNRRSMASATATVIEGGRIEANSITADQIQAGTITGDELNATTNITIGTGTYKVKAIGGAGTETYLGITSDVTPAYNNANTPFYVGADQQLSIGTKLLYTGGNLTINGGGTFTGALSGGTISIGSDEDIFKADSNGIYLGSATFGNAAFRVTPQGALTATNATITGAISGGTIDIGDDDTTSFHVDATGQMWLGSSAYATAPFKVSAGGSVTAEAGYIGGWQVLPDHLAAANNDVILDPGGAITVGATYGKQITIDSASGTANATWEKLAAFDGLWLASEGDAAGIPNLGTAGSALDAINTGLKRVEGPAVWLPGVTGNNLKFLTSTGSPELPAGDFIVEAGLDLSVPATAGNQEVFGYTSSANGGSGWMFRVNTSTGLVQITYRNVANTGWDSANSPSLVPLSSVQTWYRAVWNNTANTIEFFYSVTGQGGEWISLGSAVPTRLPNLLGNGSTVILTSNQDSNIFVVNPYLGARVTTIDGVEVFNLSPQDIAAAAPDATTITPTTGPTVTVSRSASGPVTTIVPSGVTYINPDSTNASNAVTLPAIPGVVGAGEDLVAVWVGQLGNDPGSFQYMWEAYAGTGGFGFQRRNTTSGGSAFKSLLHDGTTSYGGSQIVNTDGLLRKLAAIYSLDRVADIATLWVIYEDGSIYSSATENVATAGAIDFPDVTGYLLRAIPGTVSAWGIGSGVGIALTASEAQEIGAYLLNDPVVPPASKSASIRIGGTGEYNQRADTIYLGDNQFSLGKDQFRWDGTSLLIGDDFSYDSASNVMEIDGGTLVADTVQIKSLAVSNRGANIIANSSFTDTDFAGTWGFVEGTDSGVSVVDDSAANAPGQYAMWFDYTALTAYGSRAIPIVGGNAYRIAVWMRAPAGASGNAYVRINYRTTEPTEDFIGVSNRTGYTDLTDVNGVTSPFNKSTIASGTAYTLKEFVWTAPSTARWMSLCFYNWSSGDLYVAQVDMVEQFSNASIQDGVISGDKLNATTSITVGTGTYKGKIIGGAGTATYIGITSATTPDYGNANTPFYAGADQQVSIGDKLTFSSGNLSISGAITSTSGSIGGWSINEHSLVGGSLTLTDTGNLTAGTGNDVVRISADDATYRIWAGNATASSAKFSVTKTGSLKAQLGSIAGWTISDDSLTSPNTNVVLDGTSNQIRIGPLANHLLAVATTSASTSAFRTSTATDYNSGTGFWIDASGRLFLGNSAGNKLTYDSGALSVTGAITSSSVVINGGTISSSTYSYTSGNYSTTGMEIGLGSQGYIRAKNFAIDESGDAFFKGNGEFTGAVTASSGSIGLIDIGAVTGGEGTQGLYVGTGVFNNAATPFYIDDQGDFSLGADLRYDASETTLYVEGDAIVDGTLSLTKLNISPSSDSVIPNGDMMGSIDGTWFAYVGNTSGLSIVAAPDGVAGGRTLQHVGGNASTRISSRKFPVTGGATYAFGFWVKSDDADTDSTFYARFLAHNPTTSAAYADVPYISYSWAAYSSVEVGNLTSYPAAWGNNSISNQNQGDITSWSYIEGLVTFPADAVEAVFQFLNWNLSSSTIWMQGVWLRKQSNAVIIEDGTITTDKFDTNAIKSLSPAFAYTSGAYSTAGSKFDLANGNIITPTFSVIDGVAKFKGELEAASGTFSGDISAAFGTFTGNLTIGTGTSRFKVVSGATTAAGITTTAGTLTYNNTGTPVYMGSDGKFSLKQKLLFDGTNLTITGSLSGGEIHIGGYDTTSFHVDTNGNMWLGADTYANAASKFRVSSEGVLNASGATITGSVSSTAFNLLNGATVKASWVPGASTASLDYKTTGGASKGAMYWSDDSVRINASYSTATSKVDLYQDVLWLQAANAVNTANVKIYPDVVDFNLPSGARFWNGTSGSEYVRLGGWSSDGNWCGVEGNNVSLLVDHTSVSDAYLRTKGGVMNIGAPSNYIVFENWIKISSMATGYLLIDGNGLVYSSGSKRELKENITPIVQVKDVGAIIDQLEPVSFIYKNLYPEYGELSPGADEWRRNDVKYGFIAEDVAAVDEKLAFWEIVTEDEIDENGNPVLDGDPDPERRKPKRRPTGEMVPSGWDQAHFIALLVAEVKSLRERVADLERKK